MVHIELSQIHYAIVQYIWVLGLSIYTICQTDWPGRLVTDFISRFPSLCSDITRLLYDFLDVLHDTLGN